MSSKRLMDDVLCVVFYPDDSVRLEMTWFVQAVSVKMMNFVDWGRESDDSIRTFILIACVCPCLILSRLICFCFTQGEERNVLLLVRWTSLISVAENISASFP